MPGFVDEFRHTPGGEAGWTESWSFAVVVPGAAWGLYAQLTLHPSLGNAWWWAAVVRAGEPLLLVRDQTLDLPKNRSFEVRGDGLWADLHCHEPMRRWQVNFEGVALALDDPSDELGDRVPVEFELEWEAAAAPIQRRFGYTQRCVAHGEVQIKWGDPLALDEPAPGHRAHDWGERDYGLT